MNIAIILAGGTGTRVGATIPKQFISIQEKPVLAYALEIYQNNQNIDAIEIVCHKDWIKETRQIVSKYNISKTKWIVEGGDSFQSSTMNGIFHLKNKISPDDIVVIGLAIFPLTSQDIINDSIAVCKKYGNGITSDDLYFCTCIKDTDEYTTQNIYRENLKAFSSPWTFKYGEVYDAYQDALEKNILHSIEPHTTSLYLELGKKLYFSKSNSLNIKITTKEDLDFFEGYLLLQEKRKGYEAYD